MSYFVTIKDCSGTFIPVEVSKEIYLLFEEERKREARYIKQCKRHLAYLDLDTMGSPISISHLCYSAEVGYGLQEKLSQVRAVLETCTPTQRERFWLYVLGYSFTQIGKIQNCSRQTAQESIGIVEKKLKVFFQNTLRFD